ncbi:MAG: EamA family transporter [Rhodospirillales bacterium]|nr:EamA family transporter [Rhodospirillales bacterium]
MKINDVILALFVTLIWGGHLVIIRIGALEIPPFMLLSLRFFFCALVFLPFARRLTKDEFKNVTLYALLFQGLHMGLLFAGLAQVDAGLAGLIMKVEIPILILLGWAFYNERFGLKTLAGILIALIGGLIILYKPHEDAHINALGIICLLGSALFWAIGSVRLKYITTLNFPTMAGYAFAIPLPIITTISLIFESDHVETLRNAHHVLLAGVLLYQVALVSLAHYCWKQLMGRNPVYLVTPFTILTPIFGLIFGVIILHEPLSLTALIGAAIALTGITIVTFRRAKKQQEGLEP